MTTQKEEKLKQLLALKIQYPRLRKEKDNRCKLTEDDIELMRELNKQRVHKSVIAEFFNICKRTVYYWTSEKVNSGTKQKVAERFLKKYMNDIEFREKQNSYSNKSKNERYKTDEEFKYYRLYRNKINYNKKK